MVHVVCSLVLQVLCQINDTQILLHVSCGNVSDPSWNGCGEETNLKVSSTLCAASTQDLVNFFLEALLEHLICLVQDDSLEGREINISALDMVKNSTASTNKEVDTTAEGSGLIFDIDATVDGERVELVGMVLQLRKLVLNLFAN